MPARWAGPAGAEPPGSIAAGRSAGGSATLRWCRQYLLQHGPQFRPARGFGKDAVEQTAHDVGLGVGEKCRKRHERRRSSLTSQIANIPGGSDAVHHRHLDIQNDDVVGFCEEVAQRLFAVLRRVHIAAHAAQKDGGKDAGGGRVLGQYDARPGAVVTKQPRRVRRGRLSGN